MTMRPNFEQMERNRDLGREMFGDLGERCSLDQAVEDIVRGLMGLAREGGAISLREPSPLASGARKRSPSFGRVSTIAGEALAAALLLACLVLPIVFAGA